MWLYFSLIPDPDLGKWPDCWASVEFLSVPISQKGSVALPTNSRASNLVSQKLTRPSIVDKINIQKCKISDAEFEPACSSTISFQKPLSFNIRINVLALSSSASTRWFLLHIALYRRSIYIGR